MKTEEFNGDVSPKSTSTTETAFSITSEATTEREYSSTTEQPSSSERSTNNYGENYADEDEDYDEYED